MKKSILNNGLTIITKEDKNSKICTLGYVIKSGSYEENENERGIAHLIEHMLFKGTLNRNYKEINKEIESIGGYLNAETNYEYTKYHCTIPYDKWEIGMDVLSDMIFNHTIPEEELIKERKVVQEELKMYNDDPSSFINFKLVEKMFKNYPNRQLIGGTIESVGNITRENILDFINRNYYPENMIFIATGNVEHDKIVNFIHNYIDKLHIEFNSYQKEENEFVKYDLNNEVFKFKRQEIEQIHLSFGLFGPSYNHEDMYPLNLLITILGGNCSSILYDIIREQKGLAYTIFLDIEALKDVSIICGYAGLNAENNDTIHEILKQFKNIKQNINEELLESAKSYLIGMQYLRLEKTSGINSFLTEQLIHDNYDSEETIINKIKSVTMDDIFRVIDKYLNEKNICFMQLNKKEKEGIKYE